MSVSSSFIHRPIATSLLGIAVMLGGILGYLLNGPKSETSDFGRRTDHSIESVGAGYAPEHIQHQ